MVAFVLLIWFVNKVLWGPVTKMMADRQKRIADGLAAADKGKHELARAEEHAKKLLSDAKAQAGEIIVQAEKRGNEIVEEAKHNARGDESRDRSGDQSRQGTAARSSGVAVGRGCQAHLETRDRSERSQRLAQRPRGADIRSGHHGREHHHCPAVCASGLRARRARQAIAALVGGAAARQ